MSEYWVVKDYDDTYLSPQTKQSDLEWACFFDWSFDRKDAIKFKNKYIAEEAVKAAECTNHGISPRVVKVTRKCDCK